MANRSHLVKSIAMLLLINIALVSIASTSAGYWFTRKSGNFSGMYENNTESTYLYGSRSSLLFGNNRVDGRITVKAVADNFLSNYGKQRIQSIQNSGLIIRVMLLMFLQI